jgi:hypothetical protein
MPLMPLSIGSIPTPYATALSAAAIDQSAGPVGFKIGAPEQTLGNVRFLDMTRLIPTSSEITVTP